MGQMNDLLIKIGIDTSSAKKDIKQVEKMFDNMVKKFSKPLMGNGGSGGRGSPSKPSLPFDAKKFKAETQALVKTIKAMGGEVGKLQNKLNATKSPEGLKNIRKDVDKIYKDLSIFQEATSKEVLKDIKRQLAEENKKTQELQKQAILKRDMERERVRSKGLDIQKDLKLRKEESTLAQKNLQKRLSLYKKQKKELEKQTAFEIKQAEKLDKVKTTQAERRLKRVARMEESFRASSTFRGLDLQNQERALKRFAKIKERVLRTGDEYGFRTLSADIRDFKRQMVGLQTIQGGLQDSTRNLIRSYASLFALMEGTQAIERVGMDFQGMEVAMLASAGSAEKAKSDLKFINDIADEMGVNLKDASDAYVKLQFATKGKMSDAEVKELFFNLNRFATSLKVAPESLKNAQRAIQQIN